MSVVQAAAMQGKAHPAHSDRDVGSSAETDHRIANSLALIVSLVRTQARSVARGQESWRPDQVRLLLEEMAGRIETVGRLHLLVSRSGGGADGETDLSDYLREICDGLIAALSSAERFTIVHAPGEGCAVSVAQALPLGLIVCEVVTNAIKYAHPADTPGEVRVSCGRSPEGDVFVQIADDGVGFPDGFDAARDGGHGLRLVRGLSEQLMGVYSFDDTGDGLRFRLVIPRSELADEA